ncbi:BTAD domain-containing putative transcriptional regulator [Spongisporangium articulatum]|uniref:BTAD domain-containing putative transcriptional regulator n=1 Tax=Spongisporangium articulatum TaxID=3362603 RepID=A0ABW8AIN4_9ACTN
MSSRRYRVLGGLEVIEESGRLELGTRKQRALLGVLLLAEGRAVSTDALVDAIWGDAPPDRVEASLQSYVSMLRRALEPDRAPRAPAQVLVTAGNGYALKAPREQVDAWRFADLVEQGRAQHAEGDLTHANTTLRNALAMYAPLLPEFAGEEFQEASAQHLQRLHLVALELSYEVRLALGEHQVLVADLESAVQRHPLHEGLWALLAVARYRAGRQSDALRAIADAKRLLSEEIGVDLGPRLRQLESDLLAQAPHLDPPRVVEDARPVPEQKGRVDDVRHRPSPDEPLVGRGNELALLQSAVEAVAGGGSALILVEGEPGAGKTRLLEEAVARADGAVELLWGRCLDGEGAPSLWPWVQVMNQVQPLLDPDVREALPASDLGQVWISRREVVTDNALASRVIPDAGGRFRLFDDAGRLMESVAADRPLMIVIDDLQWADETSLELFVHLAQRRTPGVVLAAAMRDRAPGPHEQLRQALAELSRVTSQRRIRLGPLGGTEVAEIIRRQTGAAPSGAVVEGVLKRSAGNPFFVRELSRLLTDEGDHPGGEVPSSVRDVVRDRVDRTGTPTRELLQLAALIGRDFSLGLLARAADLDVEACLDRLEPAVELGLLGQPPDDPFSFRFEHDIVRESIAETITPLRVVRLHLRVAEALDALGDRADNVERLAHHLWSAGPLADSHRTAHALVEAAKRASNRYAYEAAQRHLESAVTIARTTDDGELELEAVAMLTSVIGVQRGYVGAAVELLKRGEELARRLGHERQAGSFLYSLWSAYSQRLDLVLSEQLAAQIRDRGEASDDPVLQMYGYHAWGVNAWDHGIIGVAYRSLLKMADQMQANLAEAAQSKDVLAFDLQLLSPGFLGYMTALHGDVEGARRRFDEMERELVTGPYPLVVWGSFSATTAALVGDAQWAVEVGERCIAADPQMQFVFFGTYLRIQYWWGRSMLGEAAAGCERVRALIDSLPDDSPRSGEAHWWALLAECYLEAGRPDDAAQALEQSRLSLQRTGQMYPEPSRLFVRAKWLHATGAPRAEVEAALDDVRRDATEREAFLFVQRADDLQRRLFS